MKLQLFPRWITAALLCTFAGCSGGGDSNDIDFSEEPPLASGVWSGALTRVTDTCSLSGDVQTLNFVHTVNQNSESVTLNESGGISYLGNIVGDNGFSVDGSRTLTVGGAQCTRTQQIEYDDIDSDSDTTASVDLRIIQQCPNGSTCQLNYTGTAARSPGSSNGGNPTPTPTASPQPGATPGTVPVSGGCAAINENPAAGTYSGNGGCGISDAAYDITTQGGQTVVVLNPFGANGATSFVVNSVNSSTASSTRGDLTIKGITGYSCSLTCSAPSTFTVNCFQEGGTQCVEKF
jgi:hypothetical protein